MIRPLAILILFAAAASSAPAGWDPLQKAERAAARGERLLAAGDSLGAVSAYLEAQALAPEDDRIRMGLGQAFFENGEYKSALGQYRGLSTPAPQRPQETSWDALYNAGNSAFALGDYESALDHYTRALVAGSDDPDLLHNLELAQKILEQAQSQEGEDGEPQEGENQEQQDGEQEQQQQEQQQQEQEQQPQQEQQQEEAQEDEAEQDEEAPQDQPAQADSTATAPPDSLILPEGMTLAEALQLLDALDHDEEELRKSIQRRLRPAETESEHDW